jgi:transcriptional regulator with XRE-family HTH domain
VTDAEIRPDDAMWTAHDEPTAGARLGDFPIAGLIRRARRIADLSQRELATRAGTSHVTVGRIEAGNLTPSLRLFQRLIGAAHLSLVVVDGDGQIVLPMRDREDLRDGADRRYPSHLDTIVFPGPGHWWADVYGLARPPETFHRDRSTRDMRRRRSQWEVRVAQHRYEPPPPDPSWVRRRTD